jgi:nuclease S1
MSATLLRMTRFCCLIACGALAALPSADAFAWGAVGHRTVAALAATELAPAARAEVARLLQGEADPTLAGVANWADDLRDHPPADDPGIGKRTSRWHYVNLAEDDCGYVPPKHCPDGDCVIEAIRRQRDVLADRTQPDAARAQALKFLVHFVGDAHQPLHAGYARDKGGNTFQLQVGGQGTNLHALWDSGLFAGVDDARLLKTVRQWPLRKDRIRDPAAWAEASCRIVLRDGFYPSGAKLPATYVPQWRPVAEQQLRIAGHHLAALLNNALQAPTAR